MKTMKWFVVAAASICGLSSTVHADDCGVKESDPKAIVAAILNETACDSAAKIARDCAWSSSIDTQFTGAATHVCQADLKGLSKSNQSMMSSLLAQCTKKYADRHGTLFISATAFCQLEVVELFSSLNSDIDKDSSH